MEKTIITLIVSAPIIVTGTALYLWRQRAPSKPQDQSDSMPERTLLSYVLLWLGVISLGIGVCALFLGSQGFGTGMVGLAIATVFFALRCILDYLQEILHRLKPSEDRKETKSEEP